MTGQETYELSPFANTCIVIASTFAAQFVSRLYGNWKAETESKKVINNTSSPDQVKRLDDKVVELSKEVAAIKTQVFKNAVLPDDRGPVINKKEST